MATKQSSLVIKLIDQLSGPSKKAAAGLESLTGAQKRAAAAATAMRKIEAPITAVATASKKLADGKGISRWSSSFQAEVKKLGLTAKQLDNVRAAWERFDSTVSRRVSIRLPAAAAWERDTLASLRRVEHAHTSSSRRVGRIWAAIPGIGGGYVAGRVVRQVSQKGAEWTREDARDYLAGLTPDETSRLQRTALDSSLRYPSIDATTMHERLRDTAAATGSVDKAIQLADTIAEGTAVLQSLKGKDAALDEGRKFFKGLDTLGKVDPVEIRDLYNAWIKAMSVEGADLDLGGFLQMVRQSRAAGASLDNKFLSTIAPALGQDMGDARVGTALSSGLSQIVGAKATKQSKAIQAQYGLRDRKGNFVDEKTFLANPYDYMKKTLLPNLEKRGININDDAALTAVMSRIFSNRTVADIFTKMATQREQYDRKAQQYDNAPGLDAANELPKRDPFVAWSGLTSQLTNLVTQLTSPLIPAATSALNGLTGAIGSFANYLSENKDLAGVLGAGGAAAAGGAGLYGMYKIWKMFSGAAEMLTGGGKTAAGGGAAGGAGTAATGGAWSRLWDTVKGSPLGGWLLARTLGAGYLGYNLGANIPEGEKELQAFFKANGERTAQWQATLEKLLPKWLNPDQAPVEAWWNKPTDLRGETKRQFNIKDPEPANNRDFTLGSDGGFNKLGKSQPKNNRGYLSNWDTKHVSPTPIGRGEPAALYQLPEDLGEPIPVPGIPEPPRRPEKKGKKGRKRDAPIPLPPERPEELREHVPQPVAQQPEPRPRPPELQAKVEVDTTAVDEAKAKANEAGAEISSALNVTVKPTADLSSIADLKSMVGDVLRMLAQIGPAAQQAQAAVGRSVGASFKNRQDGSLHDGAQ
ncbi:hypothetical protein CHELA1G11_10607 [Hyphomicrobiales bacterium]|nr:hypothetical protein CHELA1G11_10607 [Hyphomicrobiales bacterium]CAH1673485.1 hypothetical protein CHELA1G2_13696 [Hyphomicrobiales bacterium]